MIKLTLISFGFVNLVLGYLDSDGWLNVELYHAIDSTKPDQFTFRQNITISSLNQISGNLIKEVLSSKDRDLLYELATSNSFYRLKAIVYYPDGRKMKYLTSTKACFLANSKLNDILLVSIDISGLVLGITETVVGHKNCRMENISHNDLGTFNTNVLIKKMELGPVPDTLSFIQKLEREREARERGDIQDNRGFFAKYWMYIVPIGLLVLISGATSPEANGGGR